jgi:hypothetical protein
MPISAWLEVEARVAYVTVPLPDGTYLRAQGAKPLETLVVAAVLRYSKTKTELAAATADLDHLDLSLDPIVVRMLRLARHRHGSTIRAVRNDHAMDGGPAVAFQTFKPSGRIRVTQNAALACTEGGCWGFYGGGGGR